MVKARILNRSFTFICILLFAACKTVPTVAPHEPNLAMSRAEAKAALKQAFEEQPIKLRPATVDIDDDAVRLGFSNAKTNVWGASSTVTLRETYYFNNLGNLQLSDNGKQWSLYLSNKEHSVRRSVIFYNQDKAFLFLDAMQRMTRSE